MSKLRIETRDMVVFVDNTPEMRDKVFKRVIQFYSDVRAWSGEHVMQCDLPQEEGPTFLAELVDEVLKPTVVYKDED